MAQIAIPQPSEAQKPVSPRQALGLWASMALVIGNMIGSGIFLLPASLVIALTLWAFLGVESATIPADDVENPGKTIPRATTLGTIVTALVYMLSTIAVMGIIPLARLSSSSAPYADAAGLVWGRWAFYVVVIGAVISCLGSLNGFTLIAGQVPLATARDGLFPKVFGKISKRGVPALGVIISYDRAEPAGKCEGGRESTC